MAKTVETKETTCPYCEGPIRYSTHLGGQLPKPGDLAICDTCFEVGQYGDELVLLPFDTSQLDAGTIAEIEHTIAVVKRAQERTGTKRAR